MTILSPLIGLVPTYLLKPVLDGTLLRGTYQLPLVPQSVIPSGPWNQVVFTVGIILVTQFLQLFVGWANDWGWHYFSEHVQHTLRVDAYEKTQRLGMEFFTDKRTGQILSILNNDVNQLQDFLQNYVSQILRITVQFLGIAVVLFSLKPALATITLIPVPFMIWHSFKYGQRVRNKYGDIRQSVGKINSQVENSVNGISVVKSYTQEDYERDRVEESSEEYFESRWAMLTARIKFFPVLNFMNWIGFGLTLLVGGYWITVGTPPLPFFSGSLTIGTLVAFLTFNQQFTQPIIQIGQVMDMYEKARSSIVRVFALQDYPINITETEAPVILEEVDGDVAFDAVSFSYPNTEERVLNEVDFEVAAGQMVGLVGPTGSGKTTLIKLLLRFYDPDEGTVSLDGHEIQNLSLQYLRDAIGYVSQDPFLFDGTVKENIAYADLDADDDAIEDAARMANAHEFIESLEQGFDTRVGERGVKLSGGQRQRIAIARSVLKDPDIIVLDEATSHVDNETEVLIQNSLERLTADRTTFAIAHRLSTVRNADKILVLEEGELIERGSHEELLALEGLYANLWRVQVGEIDTLPEEFLAQATNRAP
ncbi:ABC transporter ATP-binding protein (plasmid) [Haladaptatus sp. SPP-AMP-3]|uniref:ABC transporter ATP-binding protein n=1 Tax=Haladaptatus sp. SPP-AMP-3 TaxID=3121295 RepID=UPI003C2D7F58